LVRDIFVQILVIILWHLVFVKGYIARIKIQKELVPMALFFLIFVGSYTIANPAVFPWYVVSLELIYIFGLVVGLKHFFSLNSNFGKAWGNSIIIYLVCFSCLQYNFANEKFAPFSMVWAEHPDIYGFPKKTLSYDNRENLYIQIAKDLKSEITSETIVLAPEFGAFGYYSDAKIVSSIGHINPEVLKYLPNKRNEIVGEKINHAISLEMVKGVLPDYIISLEIFFRNSLKNNEWFNSNYQIQKIYPSNVFYSEGLYVYKKI